MPSNTELPVLLVDDRPENLVALENLLADMGLDIITANSGNEALRLTLRRDFAVVLMDVQMPDIDGFETAELMRGNPKTSNIPIIFVTAGMKELHFQFKGYEIGAVDYLTKPIEPVVLRSKVRIFCELYRYRKEIEEHSVSLETLVESRTLELVQANEELRRGEEKFRTLADWTYDWEYWIDGDGALQYISPSCEHVSGYRPEEFEQDLDLILRIVHPEDQERVAEHVRLVCTDASLSSRMHEIDFRIVSKSGEIRHIGHLCRPVWTPTGAYLGRRVSNRDITERKRIQETLAERESFQHTLLDNISIGVVVVDAATFLIEELNPMAAQYLGDTAENIIGKPCHYFLCPDSMGLCPVAGKNHNRDYAECNICHADGHQIPVLKSVRPITIDGVPKYLECLVDLRERKLLEQQLIQAQKMESIGLLAGGVAHDFNNILAVILGYGELLMLDTDEGTDVHRDISEMVVAAERARELTRQLLAFSRKQVLEVTLLDLNILLKGMEKMLRRLLNEDIALTLTLSPQAGLTKGDKSQLEQVLLNLCINARDAMPTGGTLSIATQNVVLDEYYSDTNADIACGSYVVISVSDTGIGMDEAIRLQVFDPFFTTKERGKGTGLGMSTAYGIIRQHNGNISVYSEVGLGTTFRVYLPQESEELKPGVPHEEKSLQKGKNEIVVLVEDDLAVRKLAHRMLAGLGYRVEEMESAAECITYVEQGGALDLLLTDIVMPGMNGRQLYEKILELRPDIRTLFMSGYPEDVLGHHGMLKEKVNIISKPFSAAQLSNRIRDVLE